MLKCYVFGLTDTYNFLFQCFLIKELTYLEADLCIFIRIEWSNSGLGGAKGLTSQTSLLISIKQYMVRHQDLCSVRNQDVWLRNASVYDRLDLLDQIWDV